MVFIFTKNNIDSDNKVCKNVKKSIALFMSDYQKYDLNIDCDIAIINSDLDFNLYKNISAKQVITYGYNTKSTVSISSSVEDYILCAIQRQFCTACGKNIEIGEIIIKKQGVKMIDDVALGVLNIVLK